MSPFTVLILIAFAVGAFGFIDEETELNFTDEHSPSEDPSDQIREWEGKIVGGTDAQPGQFPHQVSLRRRHGHGHSHLCGGSILNRLFVLTAAHCTQGQNGLPANIRIVVGALRRDNDGIGHEVHSIYNHPEYSGRNKTNDICILRTASDILFNTRYVRPVRLPNSNVPADGNLRVITSGWGLTSRPGSLAEILQFKDALTLNRPDCIPLLGYSGRFVHENTVCVQTPIGRSACDGDSGGPLITIHGVQVGVVSWGVGCAIGLPEVYANVWSHIEWIRATIQLELIKNLSD